MSRPTDAMTRKDNNTPVLDEPAVYRLLVHLITHGPVAVCVRDPDGRYRWVNQAYAALYDRAASDMIGAPMDEFGPRALAGEQQWLDAEMLTRACETTIIRPHRFALRLNSRRTRHVAGYLAAVRSRNGRAFVAGFYLDLTEQMRAKRELFQMRERHRAVAERSTIPVLVCDPDGTVSDANPALCELLGRQLHDLRGATAGSLLFNRNNPQCGAWWGELLGGKIPSHRARVLLDRKTEAPVEVRFTASVSRSPDGQPASVVFAVEAVRQMRWATMAGSTPLLSEVQARVLERVAIGDSNAAIGRALNLSRQSIDYHLAVLRRRLRAPSRTALVSHAYALGLLDAEEWPPTVHAAARPTEPR
ncbi:helix-turn-helix transcriptional regulator [Allokutzneria albata]|uniref:helix-turn-helix transcriptional regulator n=1 Tax=Allokutzneria albata TaxID=211114 RepID=UPI00138E5078|nr:PAS domain-containing protein [Allokutzneria albata]